MKTVTFPRSRWQQVVFAVLGIGVLALTFFFGLFVLAGVLILGAVFGLVQMVRYKFGWLSPREQAMVDLMKQAKAQAQATSEAMRGQTSRPADDDVVDASYRVVDKDAPNDA